MHLYAHTFGWSDWPFRVVVDDDFAKIWADRADLREEIRRRKQRISALSHSTIQLLWADFGAGKSHTLRHLQYLCGSDAESPLIPVYSEVPVRLDGVRELYERFTDNLPEALLDEFARTAAHERPELRTGAARDLRQALRLIASADQQGRTLAFEWIRGQRGVPHATALRRFGISGRIESEDQVVGTLAEIARIARSQRPGGALLWLLDEFQRVAELPAGKRDNVLRTVVSLFNRCPQGLHLVLSFSVAQQDTISTILPPELMARARTFGMLALPFLTEDDARIFITDLLRSFSADPGSNTLPLTDEALEYVLSQTAVSASGRLTPRLLMETFEHLFMDVFDLHGRDVRLPLSVAALPPMVAG